MVKNDNSVAGYFIYHVSNQSRLLVEENFNELVDETLIHNFKIVDSIEEVNNQDFIGHVYYYYEFSNSFIKITIEEAQQRIKKKNKKGD